jgi:hypothetical protein
MTVMDGNSPRLELEMHHRPKGAVQDEPLSKQFFG